MRMNLAIVSALSLAPLVAAHARWSCPEPRSQDTGIKTGPCGDDLNDFGNPLLAGGSDGAVLEIKPGPLRVTFEETVHHTGAPFRISLSGDGSDDESCTLLDHVPHNDCCRPSYYDPATYTQYSITINIPNVICDRCSLHLSNPMTDKIRQDGSPTGIGCTDPGTCFSVYHSCTRPFRIAGDANNGAVPRSEYKCDYPSYNADWPLFWAGDNGESVRADTPGTYRRESSIWSSEDFTLTTAPVQYREDAGGVCGEQSEDTITTTNPTTDGASASATEPPAIVDSPESHDASPANDNNPIPPTPPASETIASGDVPSSSALCETLVGVLCTVSAVSVLNLMG